MNAGVDNLDPSIEYYDSDYPSKYFGNTKNFDKTTVGQGLSDDVPAYLDHLSKTGGPALEICCGTGRISIPVARAGHKVTAVDISSGLLQRFGQNLESEDAQVRARIDLVEQDATRLKLPEKKYKLAICGFNSLLCVTSSEQQIELLRGVAEHLADDGIFLLDIVNPLGLNHLGDSKPKVFFTRKSAHSGNIYSRISMCGALDENQKQELFGWYDEVESNGTIRRSHYSVFWRPIFRFEIEYMLRFAGLKILEICGGHCGEPFQSTSPRMFIKIAKDIH